MDSIKKIMPEEWKNGGYHIRLKRFRHTRRSDNADVLLILSYVENELQIEVDIVTEDTNQKDPI